jgi:hypothetical protein
VSEFREKESDGSEEPFAHASNRVLQPSPSPRERVRVRERERVRESERVRK